MFYFTTSIQMKHFQCIVHKPECSIQTQVVILKVLMIKSSAVAEPRYRDKNRSRSSIHFSKSAVNTLFFRRFHYVHLTTCVRLEEIIYHQNFHSSLIPSATSSSLIQFQCLLYHIIPVIFSADKFLGLCFIGFYHFRMVAGVL